MRSVTIALVFALQACGAELPSTTTSSTATATGTATEAAAPATPQVVVNNTINNTQSAAPATATEAATAAAPVTPAAAPAAKSYAGEPGISGTFTWEGATMTGMPKGYHLASRAEAVAAVTAGKISDFSPTDAEQTGLLAWTSTQADANNAYAVNLSTGDTIIVSMETQLTALFVSGN